MITKFEIFEEDTSVLGYFICDRHRAVVDLHYCEEFYKKDKTKLYKTVYDAYKAYQRNFYDDSDVKIVRLFSDGEMEILNWNNIRNEIMDRIK